MEKQFERYFCVIELTGNAKKSYLLTFYFWSKFFYIQPSSLDAGKRGVTLTEAHIDLHWAISSENLRSLQKPFVLFWNQKKQERVLFFRSSKSTSVLSFTRYEVICLLTYPIYFLLFPLFFKRDSSSRDRKKVFSCFDPLSFLPILFCCFSNWGSQLFYFTKLSSLFWLQNPDSISTSSFTTANLLHITPRTKKNLRD
jgi:hypothetical protein